MYLQPKKNNEEMKHKDSGTCYEKFRRESSLTSLQINKNNTSLSNSVAKLKNINHMEEVQNLSAQLDKLSKRPLTSRNFVQHTLSKCSSSSSLKDVQDPAPLKRQLSSNLTEQTVLKDSERIQAQSNTPKGSKYKFNNSALFNQFDIIEEGSYVNEQQNNETLQPVTFKATANIKQNQKKLIVSKNDWSKLQPQIKITLKPQINSKKDKMKHDISQLDKMQKQLELKRITQDKANPKLNSSFSKKSTKEPTLKDGFKGLKKSLNADKRVQFDPPVSNNRIKPEQAFNVKTNKTICQQAVLKQQLVEEDLCNQKSSKMEATRMLTDREKGFLSQKFKTLLTIIDKNEICSEGFHKLKSHIDQIEKLLIQ